MAGDWSAILLRFAVYLDLMVLFGVPLFALQALGARGRDSWVGRRYMRLAAAACVLGAVLSVLGLVAMAREMVGATDYSQVSRHVLEMVVTRTGAGIAWAIRIAAFAVCGAALVVLRGRVAARFGVLSGAGAVALATLAWSGHGAMDDGARGVLHLASDVLHLLAAGAWVGALVAFVSLSHGADGRGAESFDILERAASGFAGVGTAIVAALLVSGVVNYWLIAGPTLVPLFTTLYGALLATKLAVVLLMLGLAAANRFRFAPRLQLAVAAGRRAQAERILRRSLTAEAGFGCLVLLLMAWLGVLSPTP